MKEDKRQSGVVRSCGGILHSKSDATVAVLYNTKRNFYELPKGRKEPGETLAQTAAREVFEETGYPAHIADEEASLIGAIVRPIRNGRFKVVHWFSCELVGTKQDHTTGTQDSYESFETKWLPVDEAVDMLRYDSQASLLKHALRLWYPERLGCAKEETDVKGRKMVGLGELLALDAKEPVQQECLYLYEKGLD